MTTEKLNDHHIVGIGASAGGLEALENFFVNMPVDSGLAFVVIQHLSPDYKSLMVELLGKRTEIPVNRASDGMQVEPNNIYIIPPRKNITIFHRKLYLSDRGDEHLHLPIDIFLNSLAEDVGDKAVGVILSGTGSDGTRGVRAIKEVAGMVMAQDERTAKFDGMPRSAIATKLVDFILPPEEMPENLLKYVKHPAQRNPMPQPDAAGAGDHLSKIYSLLRNRTGIDFTYYKQTTMLRRIERRMSINQIDTIEEYAQYLYQNKQETKILHKELLIGVTRFFREPEAFIRIEEELLPKIFENKTRKDEVRIWIAGCSTGEEAYSIAILLDEYMEKQGKSVDVKIFATDIDREALDFAGRGIYSESIAADVPKERLHNHFVRREGNYEILPRIREMVIFAQQDLTRDPPFSKIDLITCRNVLIYLQTVLQRKVLSAFQFALKTGGFLFLGISETVGDMEDALKTYDHKWRIYQYQGGTNLPLFENAMYQPVLSRRPHEPKHDLFEVSLNTNKQTERIYRSLIEGFMVPTLIIDDATNLLHAFGDVDKFLQVPTGGRFSTNILKMVRGNLSIPLHTAVRRSLKDDTEVVYNNVSIHNNNESSSINLHVSPLRLAQAGQKLLIIQFHDVDTNAVDKNDNSYTFDIEGSARQRIADLEQELQYTKENLQATIEELETANEELQATNEELLASNEELQSTNEELQSVNEELITVNAEHQMKIQELIDLNADMNNLFASTDVGTVFLDRQLRIRKFTPAAQQEINLLEKDIGRPLSHISHNLKGCDLAQEARKVLDNLTTREREVRSANGNYYLLKFRPYYTLNDTIGGVIIVLIDITDITELRALNQELQTLSEERRKAQVALAESEQFLQSTLDALQAHIAILDRNGTIIAVNQAWRNFADDNGMSWDDYGVGRNYLRVSESGESDENNFGSTIARGIRDIIDGRIDQFQFEYPCHSPDEERWFLARITSFRSEDSLRIVVSHNNVTPVKIAESTLALSHELANNIVNTVDQALVILDENLHIEVVNNAFSQQFGLSADEAVGHAIYKLGNSQWDNEGLRQKLSRILDTHAPFDYFQIKNQTGLQNQESVQFNGRLLKQTQNKPARILLAISKGTTS